LNVVLENTLSDLEISIDEKSAVLTVGKLPVIEAIPGQIRQLFQNLISNALKFSEMDVVPTIDIWSEYILEKDLHATAVVEGPYVRIHVKDNGIGFDEVYANKIFTIFQRLHGRREYEGTGIGLAIVKKIVEKHDGIVGVRSAEGAGADFIIVLPIQQTSSIKSNLHERI